MLGYDGGGIRLSEIVGFGTSRLKAKELKKALYDAILKCNVRVIDTAKVYGNEHIIGEVLEDIINNGGQREMKGNDTSFRIHNNENRLHEDEDMLSIEDGIYASSSASDVNGGANAGTATGQELKPLKREDFYIISKVWNDDHRPEHVRQSCLKSLKDLKVDYIDLYLVHWYVLFCICLALLLLSISSLHF